MFYTSTEHQRRFMESLQRLDKLGGRAPDAEYAAALFILTATAALWDKASGYVDAERIEFPALLAEQDFSGGYGVLVTLAGHLFNGRMYLEPLELLRLDEKNFHVALTALQIRRDSSIIRLRPPPAGGSAALA
jgi:hypothetical protein